MHKIKVSIFQNVVRFHICHKHNNILMSSVSMYVEIMKILKTKYRKEATSTLFPTITIQLLIPPSKQIFSFVFKKKKCCTLCMCACDVVLTIKQQSLRIFTRFPFSHIHFLLLSLFITRGSRV